MKENKREKGTAFEKQCVKYLMDNGVSVIECNFRNRYGEIDIIGRDENYLVFFEVKYRKSDFSGNAESAVNYHKQRIICKVSDYYRVKKGYSDNTAVRYDVLAINGESITWYKNAFDYAW